MELNFFLLFSLLIIGVACQYDINTLNLINATQQLQDLERHGQNVYPTIYPKLNDTALNNFGNQSGSANNIPTYIRPINVTRPSIEKFINKTLSTMPSGVCINEVPTASLLKKNDVLVAGNGSDPALSRIQVCCDGFQRSAYVFRKCDPICRKGCGSNGICVAPETCTCYPNHEKNSEGLCVPTCPVGCENGVCNPDNTCRCNVGYAQDATGKVCAPKCDRPCINGYCSGPNICSCKSNFAKDVADPTRCIPTCSPPCENAICSGPNLCLCYSGYVKDRSGRGSNKCVKQ